MRRVAGSLALFLSLLPGLDALATVTPLPGSTPQEVRRGDHFAPLRVRVTNEAGAAVVGATVRWNLPTYRPDFILRHDSYANCFPDLGQNCRVTSGADGVAELNPTFAEYAGSHTLRVFADTAEGASLGWTDLVLSATPLTTPATLRVFGGDAQTGIRGSTLAQPFIVQMVAPDGAPRPNVAVTFAMFHATASGSSGVFPGNALNVTVTTDAQGIAAAPPMTIRMGLGPGVVKASAFDPVAGMRLEADFTFTSTTPDGSTALALQDTWWAGPHESGWGLSIAQEGDLLFTVLFVYDDAGQPSWYTLDQASWAANARFERMMARLYSPTGSPYFAYDVSRFVPGPAGPLGAFHFLTADDFTLQLSDSSGTTASKVLRRFEFTGSGQVAPIDGLTGLWWGGPSQAGWAVSISERDGALFGLWFTYDENGARTWFSLTNGAWQAGTRTYSGTIYRTQGPRWPNFDPALLTTTAVGSFTLAFTDADNGTFEWTLGGRTQRIAVTRYRP